MARHSFAYGTFILGRYKSGALKHKFYVKDAATGQFVNKATKKQVLKDIFRPRRIWRLTKAFNVPWQTQRPQGFYYSVRWQRWDSSKVRNEAYWRLNKDRILKEMEKIVLDEIEKDTGKRYKTRDLSGWGSLNSAHERVTWDRKTISRGKVVGPVFERRKKTG